jgi:hypothetical protein
MIVMCLCSSTGVQQEGDMESLDPLKKIKRQSRTNPSMMTSCFVKILLKVLGKKTVEPLSFIDDTPALESEAKCLICNTPWWLQSQVCWIP